MIFEVWQGTTQARCLPQSPYAGRSEIRPMLTNTELLETLLESRLGDDRDAQAKDDAALVALGLLAVAEAIDAHTEALREGFADHDDAGKAIARAIHDRVREVAFVATRIARGAC